MSKNKILNRLEELKALNHGWLDRKKSFALNKTGIDWLSKTFQHNYADEYITPYIYPTPEGSVQVEWSVNDWEITLEVDLEQHQGQWHALNVVSEQEEKKTLNLNKFDEWEWVTAEITKYCFIIPSKN
jgi:hypothetical protein